MSEDSGQVRAVERILPGRRVLEGEGFPVYRPFPSAELDQVDPFLLLDEMGPVDYGPGEARGAPDHPHRGFETVTYMLHGVFEHRDSAGRRGRIGPGDVQWMTAGAGVLHAEMPAEEFRQQGGHLHAVQLWVNLPRRAKRVPPRYQELPAARIPQVADPSGQVRVRVIAGEAMGVRAAIVTYTPIFYLHFILASGAQWSQPVPESFNVLAYLLRGAGSFGRVPVAAAAHHAVLFERGGSRVWFAAGSEQPLEVLLLGGEPLREPIARYGPFVMNTREEIAQAFEDFRQGRFGTIPR